MTTRPDAPTYAFAVDLSDDEAPNTVLEVMYRDASNYKKQAAVAVAGRITSDQLAALAAALDEGMYFIAEQVALPNPRDEFGGLYYDDHCWCELTEVRHGGDRPTDSRTIDELVEAFTTVTWDPATYGV